MKETFFKTKRGQANSLSAFQVYRLLRPHVKGLLFVIEASIEQDRLGIDYIAYRRGLRPLYIDLKELSHTPSREDLILLETSMKSSRHDSPGWANDPEKRTDIVLITRGDGSFLVLSSRRIREALHRKEEKWREEYRTGINWTRGYYERFACGYMLVPRAALERECVAIAREWRN